MQKLACLSAIVGMLTVLGTRAYHLEAAPSLTDQESLLYLWLGYLAGWILIFVGGWIIWDEAGRESER